MMKCIEMPKRHLFAYAGDDHEILHWYGYFDAASVVKFLHEASVLRSRSCRWFILTYCSLVPIRNMCGSHEKRSHLLAITSGGTHFSHHGRSWSCLPLQFQIAQTHHCVFQTPTKKGQLGISQRREQGEFRSEFRWLKA